ncbi:MAG: hypothetical protein J6Y94_05535 [Bacteriovoracaceae bacterium]|nr:hypothetical protein [Bacteriovoracaceae bacterium]
MARLFSFVVLSLMTVVAFSAAHAEEFDPLLPDSPAQFDHVEKQDPAANKAINIDGEFAPRPTTEADLIRQEREALQKKNEEMIRAKIEDIRLQNEIEIGKKMDRLLDQPLPPEASPATPLPSPAK